MNVRQREMCLLAGLLILVSSLCLNSKAFAYGPNLLVNSGFEGGDNMGSGEQGWVHGPAFGCVQNAANTSRTGHWSLKLQMNASGSDVHQLFAVIPETQYITTIWSKGDGRINLAFYEGNREVKIQETQIVATGKWTQSTILWKSGKSVRATLAFINDGDASGTVFVDDVFTGMKDCNTIKFDAADPARSGFKHLIVDDEFTSSSSIDTDATNKDGYKWYPHQFYTGYPAQTLPNNAYSVKDGALEMCGTTSLKNGCQLNSARNIEDKQGSLWAGTGIAAGEGVYAEARIAMENIDKITTKGGWPAWWMLDLYSPSGIDQMEGAPKGWIEDAEIDIMEYNPIYWGAAGYNSGIIDWANRKNLYADNGLTCPPPGTDYTQYHTYGMLWIPASANNGVGYRQVYFDGQAQAAVCWLGDQTYKGAPGQPTYDLMGKALFSVTDRHVYNLCLSASPWGVPTMKVDYVRVYAKSKESLVVKSLSPDVPY